LAQRQGAKLVACCLNDNARVHVEPLTQPLGIDLVNCDVEQTDALDTLLQYVQDQLGGLDFVVHSIAWAPLADLHGRVVDSSMEGFCRAMAVSCHSFAALAKRCAPLMPDGGSMITMSYLGAEEVVPNYGLMGPVKAALESCVKYMAAELGSEGIRVNALSSGPIQSRAASGIPGFDDLMDRIVARTATGKPVTIDEVGNAAAFLVSDLASHIHGQMLLVDGGMSAWQQPDPPESWEG